MSRNPALHRNLFMFSYSCNEEINKKHCLKIKINNTYLTKFGYVSLYELLPAYLGFLAAEDINPGALEGTRFSLQNKLIVHKHYYLL